jgi:protein required for attachment to host cells
MLLVHSQKHPTEEDIMDAVWIVSANAARARLFAQARATDVPQEVDDMVNPAARLRAAELETDSLGQRAASKSRHGVGAPTTPSGYEPDTSPAEHQTELFAKSVADFLLHAHQQQRYRQLVLVASPEFLGVLRKQLEPQLTAALKAEINKDYTQLRPEQLLERIRAHQ